MKRFGEQFNKQASSIRMRARERRELRDRLHTYMEYHPLPAHLRAAPAKTSKATAPALVSESFTTFTFNFSMIRNVVGLMAVVLVVGVPLVAERSVPGDVLYPVKVQFNEEVRSSLSLSPYAQVEWETQRLERRLAEARLLASEGKLTDIVEAAVAEAVRTHSDSAKANIAKLREQDADQAAIAEITFASALAVQSEVLEGQAAKETTESNQVADSSVADLAMFMAEEQRVAEATQANAKPSYAKLLARIEMESTHAQELFASIISDVASPSEVADIERRLADINRKVNQAINLHDGPMVETMEETGELDTPEPEAGATETVAMIDAVTVIEADLATATSRLEDSNSDATASVTEPTVELAEGSEITATQTVPVELDTETAAALLRTVLADVRKLISFMTNIDVRENVNIDELVPMTLTDDEQIALIKNTLSEIETIEAEIERRIVPEPVYEKFVIGEEKLATMTEAAVTAMEKGALEVAKAQADEALVVAADLFAMTSATPQLQEVAPVETEEVDVSTTTDETATSETETVDTAATTTEFVADEGGGVDS